MRDDPADGAEFRDGMPFVGSRLWIDFLNSAPAISGDLIATPEGLSRWFSVAGMQRRTDAKTSAQDVAGALHLRQKLSEMFEALRERRLPASSAVAEINRLLAGAPTIRQLKTVEGQIIVQERAADGVPEGLIRIAADLADFIADHDAARLRHCSNPECNMVFYDTARNATRRWCSMSLCGNRNKVAAFRARISES